MEATKFDWNIDHTLDELLDYAQECDKSEDYRELTKVREAISVLYVKVFGYPDPPEPCYE